ncbi:helix-turn-helix domain-containing protein [Methylobacterium sp. CM6244]
MQNSPSSAILRLADHNLLYEAMEIFDRLKMARQNAGHATAKDAAQRLGVPYGTYSGHESGTRGIKKEDIERYAKAFDVSLSWLAFGLDLQTGDLARPARFVGTVKADGVFYPVSPDTRGDDLEKFPPLPLRRTVQGVVLVDGHGLKGFAEDKSLIYLDLLDNEMTENKIGTPCFMTYITDQTDYPAMGYPYPGASSGKYNIERLLLPTMRDMIIHTAVPVMAIVPHYTALKLKEFYKPKDQTSLNLKNKFDIPRY